MFIRFGRLQLNFYYQYIQSSLNKANTLFVSTHQILFQDGVNHRLTTPPLGYMPAQRRASRKHQPLHNSQLAYIHHNKLVNIYLHHTSSSKKGTLTTRVPECPHAKTLRLQPLRQTAILGQELLHLGHLYFNLPHQHLNHQHLALKRAQQDNHAAQSFTGHHTGILSLTLSQVQKTTFNNKFTLKTLQHLQDKDHPQNLTSLGLNFSHQHPQISTASVTKTLSMLTVTTRSIQT